VVVDLSDTLGEGVGAGLDLLVVVKSGEVVGRPVVLGEGTGAVLALVVEGISVTVVVGTGAVMGGV
jgi:hypothetical protein